MTDGENFLLGMLAGDLFWILGYAVLLFIGSAVSPLGSGVEAGIQILNAWIVIGALMGIATVVAFAQLLTPDR